MTRKNCSFYLIFNSGAYGSTMWKQLEPCKVARLMHGIVVTCNLKTSVALYRNMNAE